MRENDTGGVVRQRLLDDLARINAGAVDSAAKDFPKGNHSIAVIEH